MNRTLSIEAVPDHPEFRALRGLAGVRADLRYAGSGNFVGCDMYSPFDCAWLHRDAAGSLERAAALLGVAGSRNACACALAWEGSWRYLQCSLGIEVGSL